MASSLLNAAALTRSRAAKRADIPEKERVAAHVDRLVYNGIALAAIQVS
jgi:hypothetical protein